MLAYVSGWLGLMESPDTGHPWVSHTITHLWDDKQSQGRQGTQQRQPDQKAWKYTFLDTKKVSPVNTHNERKSLCPFRNSSAFPSLT